MSSLQIFQNIGAISKNQVEKASITSQCQLEFQSNVCILSLLLDSKSSRELGKSLHFISNEWAEAWFSNQHYKKSIHQDLLRGITQLSCPKALKCFQTHWVDIPSAVEVARSNVVAERVVKIMEEIQKNSKHKKYLCLKLLNSNLNM